jgi:hypothetical protein
MNGNTFAEKNAVQAVRMSQRTQLRGLMAMPEILQADLSYKMHSDETASFGTS